MIKLKFLFSLLFLYICFNLPAQHCIEFERALETFNTRLSAVRNIDGSISRTKDFQTNNLAVILACHNCLNDTAQANNIKNHLVFTYKLGLHYYYDLKFELATEELKACLKNPRNIDLLPGRQITYADASRHLIKEMSYPQHGSGTFTIYYDGKGGLVPELLVEHGMEDTATKSFLWSEDLLLDFSKLAYRVKDSAEAIKDYKTMFDDIEFKNPVLTIYHKNHSSAFITNTEGQSGIDSIKKAIFKKYPQTDKQIAQFNLEYARIKRQSDNLQKQKDSVCSVLNKLPEIKNSDYYFYNDFVEGIVIKKHSSRVRVNQISQQNVINRSITDLPHQNYSQTSLNRNFLPNKTLPDSDFFYFLSSYFKRKYSDSIILTVHVIDSPYDTAAGHKYYLSTAQKLHLPGPKGSLGYFNPIANSIVYWKPSGEGTLTHELTHAYLNNAFPDCPLWLNEGVASLFEECYNSDGDFIPKDNWRLIYIAEYYKLKSHHLPLLEIFSDISPRSVAGDVLRKCYARYFCIYLKERLVLPEALELINDNFKSDYTQKLSDLLKFKKVNDLQEDWEKWLGDKGYGRYNRFNNAKYIEKVLTKL